MIPLFSAIAPGGVTNGKRARDNGNAGCPLNLGPEIEEIAHTHLQLVLGREQPIANRLEEPRTGRTWLRRSRLAEVVRVGTLLREL
jgi:hypothetical protein